MNFLAHLHLAGSEPSFQLANFLGDFTKGRVDAYPVELRAGICFHRMVDQQVDRHPVLSRSKHLVAPERRRWSGVISDLIWDHFLAKHWNQFSGLSLSTFCRAFYLELAAHPEWHYGRLAHVAPALCQERWLEKYATLDGMRRSFYGMSLRTRRSLPLRGGILDLTENYSAWEARFFHGYVEISAELNRRSLIAKYQRNALSADDLKD